MQKTNIKYLTHTCSPLAMRCTPVSSGCANCWHITMADRFKNNSNFSKEIREAYAGDRPPILIESRLDAIVRHKKPAVIGLQFMGDLFGEGVTEFQWLQVFDTVRRSIYNGGARPGHTFIILTKRVNTMKLVLESLKWDGKTLNYEKGSPFMPLAGKGIYIGVSVEDQPTADERIPILLQIPAAVRFISYEPALGGLNLIKYLNLDRIFVPASGPSGFWRYEENKTSPCENIIDWIIAGCESGPNRRPADIEWFRDVRNQCVAAGIPYFLKQIEVEFGNGKLGIEKMPFLDGQRYDQMPGKIVDR